MSVGARYALDYSWLHDDLEEDFVGADWHQNAIRALSTSLKTLAEGRGWPWHVGDQLTVICEKPDATEWRPGPDISIHPRLGPADRQDIDARVDGAPILVIEVASASTWRYDVSLESARRGKRQVGKAFGYLFVMGVPEYLVFDPRAEYLAGQIRAWRRVGDVAEEWRPDDDGHYHSRALDVAFRPDGPLLRAFDPDERPVPYWFETGRENSALARENSALARENSALAHETATQAQRIADLEAALERARQKGD